MTDKISKALERLSPKEEKWVNEILIAVKSGNISRLNVKKLKGTKDIYRVRKGDIRVIYRQIDDRVILLTVERKSEKTYRNF